jgi:hypothetical protein
MFRYLTISGGTMKKTITTKQLILSNAISMLIIISLFFTYQAVAAPNNAPAAPNMSMDVLSYQGTLVDSSGSPVTGNQDITLRIYNHATDPTPLWEEAHTGTNAVPVQNGLFNVMLGSLNPIPDSVWYEAELYLGIQVGTEDEMTPRELINLLPPKIAPGSLDANVLRNQSMPLDVFSFYTFETYQGEITLDNNNSGARYALAIDSCTVWDTWCCNPEDTICLYKSTTNPSQVAFKLESDHSYSCWLVHHEDDSAMNSREISYATDGGNQSPFVEPEKTFFFMRENTDENPLVSAARYQIVCFK